MHVALKFWRHATTLVLIITLAACGGGSSGGSSGGGSVSAAGLSKGTVQDSAGKEGAAASATGTTSTSDAAPQPAEVRYAP